MSDFKIAIIAAIVGGISGGIIGGLLGILGVRLGNKWNIESTNKTVELSFKKAEELITKQEFLKAAAEFQSAFTEELRKLIIGFHKDKAQHIVNDAIVKHENAIIRFRHYLPKEQLASLDATWTEYKKHSYNSKHSNREIDIQDEKAQKKLAIKNIKELLEFANHG